MCRHGKAPLKTAINNVAVKNNQYQTIHDQRPEGYEHLLTGLEIWLKPVLESIISEELLPEDPQKLTELKLFASLQNARSPSVRELIRSAIAPHVVKTSNSLIDVSLAEGLLRYPKCDFPMFVDVYQGLADNLEKLPVFLFLNSDGNFVCPDDPVFLQCENIQSPSHADNSNSSKTITRVLFPISSRLLIQFGGSNRKPNRDPIPVDTKAVLQCNKDSVYYSKAVYGRSKELVEVAAEGWLRDDRDRTAGS